MLIRIVSLFLSILFYSQNKRRREEEEYYAAQQAGYVASPPKKQKWYQKFRRNKNGDAAPVQTAGYDASEGGDFNQMQDDESTSGWSARSFGTRSYA